MTEQGEDHAYSLAEQANRRVGLIRLAIGAGQGLMAWLLLERALPWLGTSQVSSWAERHPTLFAQATLIAAFVPILALAEIGRMRWRRLAVYLATVSILLALLATYDIWRAPLDQNWDNARPHIWPSGTLLFCTAMCLFIVNQLMEHRERGLRLFSDYAARFEDGWMRGAQLVLSLVFTLLVWGVLSLGSALFGLIELDWFGRMIEKNWFRCPVLGLAFAASIQITDVRPTLLKGMRNLGLTLLSWLLPLVILLGLAFLVGLAFTGLHPLWKTRMAASILMWAAAVTLLLLNAAYKDGEAANAPPAPIRWAGRVAGPLILIYTLLACQALALRIGQYGLSQDRIWLGAVAVVGLGYGIGYSWAAIDRDSWLKRIEPINVAASIGILGVTILLLTPLADPARWSVNNQLGRLHAGKIAPAQFDYAYLRFKAGRYGTEALAALTHDRNADIAARARRAQTAVPETRWLFGQDSPAATEPPLSHASIYPRGASLPADFKPGTLPELYDQDAACLTNGSPCDIILLEPDRLGMDRLLIIGGDVPAKAVVAADQSWGIVLGRGTSGRWIKIGSLGNLDCPNVLDTLRRGKASALRPLHDDLEVGGYRLPFTPDAATREDCPAPPRPPQKPAPARDPKAPPLMGPAFGNPGGL